MQKIKTIKFFNAIKVGRKQLTFLDQNTQISATKSGVEIKLEDAEGYVAYTSIFNSSYWTLEEIDIEPTGNASSVKGSRKKRPGKST
jgi:hypothetical protein